MLSSSSFPTRHIHKVSSDGLKGLVIAFQHHSVLADDDDDDSDGGGWPLPTGIYN